MKCPGQDSRYWKPGAIFEAKCPECGHEVEFFKDDTTRKCKNCGHRFLNPSMDFGCAAYCKHAEQCIGDLPPELIAQKENLLKDRVAVEMKRYFKQDFRRIGHATRVARYAEKIGKEEGGNLAVILLAAYLHDIGIKEAERKHQSTAARYQEMEGPPVAREILRNLGTREDLIDEVCDIVGHHHHPRPDDDINFKSVYDADLIANLEEKHKKDPADRQSVDVKIEELFMTGSGRRLAREILIGG
ncbi:MAG: HD domain-containing protein [Deltaproteobacteria bacterium]|nr:HD domain-containing protein [Deltaproteobacteria bacterium]MBW2138195.1 HD domain-containing protein [Deltaproteobacteria bacterium]